MIEMTSTYQRAFDEHFANCANGDKRLVIVNIRNSKVGANQLSYFCALLALLESARQKKQVMAHSQGS